MNQSISRKTAQQIVEAIKDVCGYDINFIRPDGIIDASTDPDRVGTFHEIGKQVAQSGKTLEVQKDDSFLGSRRGINMPFVYRGEAIAVIGISGEPDEVRKYAYLAERITWLILRERELEVQSRNQQEETHYVIRALTQGEDISAVYLEDYLRERGYASNARYRTVLIRLNPRWNPTNLPLIEQQLLQCFRRCDSTFYAYFYPREYRMLLLEEAYPRAVKVFQELTDSCEGLLSVGIGSLEPLRQQHRSCENAELAVRTAAGKPGFVACYDDLDLEMLLSSIPKNVQETYKKKTIAGLSDKDRALLLAYFSHGCRLKETADALFIHKNTLQYQLDRIHGITGYNPRTFRDAVVLYTALCL